jgi:hypothetical protein
VETGAESGLFTGSFQIPEQFCDGTNFVTVTGTDIEVNYQDYRNSSGESTEVGDGASVNANTGSVAFDRTVYPVPYDNDDFDIHATANNSGSTLELDAGSVVVHVRVTDADYNVLVVQQQLVVSCKVILSL